jgi:hypothetical protein
LSDSGCFGLSRSLIVVSLFNSFGEWKKIPRL